MSISTKGRIWMAREVLRLSTSDHESALKDAAENLDDAEALLLKGESTAAIEKLVLAEEQILSAHPD